MISVNDYNLEIQCEFKGEHYSVRDNGAVLRHARNNKSLRRLDNKWTFGKPNNYAYLLIGPEVIHRIVAYGFIGEPPTAQHIVDHIDTNRQNNRPENLRWLTKLENILKNPITVKKIIFYCGSIEAFLENPSILKNYIKKDPNFEWMRTVNPEEAKISWEKLSNWAKKKNNNTSSLKSSLGESLYKASTDYSSFEEPPEYTPSETPNAVQRNWKTPSEFPCCPQEVTDNALNSYVENLKTGEIFSRNKYSYSIIYDYALSEDENTLWIVCKAGEDKAIKPWLLAQVTYQGNKFVHANLGSFFEKIGVEKQFIRAQGLEWSGEDSIDDLT